MRDLKVQGKGMRCKKKRISLPNIVCVLTVVIFFFVNSTSKGLKGSSDLFFLPVLHPNDHAAPTLKDTLLEYDWKNRDFSKLSKKDQELLIYKILTYNIKEPAFPVCSTCTEPKLIKYTPKMCQDEGNAFTGFLRKNGTKMAHIINFGFEPEVLEIHLNELYLVVDKIFICECSYINGVRGIKKPFVWDLVKDQPRFKKFEDKVVQIKITDKDINKWKMRKDMWYVESTMERLRWIRFLEWNREHKYFKDDDVVGFGDTDEIASIKNLNLIKQCETKAHTDVGIWFTRGRISEKEITDFPVIENPFALGDPTFFTIKQAKMYQKTTGSYPNRLRGSSPYYVLGGLHITSYRFLPQYLLKLVTMSESNSNDYNILAGIVDLLRGGASIHEAQRFVVSEMSPGQKERGMTFTMDPDDIGKNEFILPWFLECNEKRYSPFFEEVLDDSRLG